jgi:predicted RNA-binding protein with PUA-like domain
MPKSSSKSASKKIASLPDPRTNQGRYWLLKSEPDVFSIDDLAGSPKQTTHWDGVRNYQARNTLRDDMKLGDLVLFYHSNAKPPGIAGIAKVVREGYPDHTAWDPNDDHYDPKSDPSHPTWMMVDIRLVQKFPRELSLPELREMPALANMLLLRKGSRLSVQPVSAGEYAAIVAAAQE